MWPHELDLQVKFDGMTGPVEFDEEGFRTNFKLDVMELSLDSELTKVNPCMQSGKHWQIYKNQQNLRWMKIYATMAVTTPDLATMPVQTSRQFSNKCCHFGRFQCSSWFVGFVFVVQIGQWDKGILSMTQRPNRDNGVRLENGKNKTLVITTIMVGLPTYITYSAMQQLHLSLPIKTCACCFLMSLDRCWLSIHFCQNKVILNPSMYMY